MNHRLTDSECYYKAIDHRSGAILAYVLSNHQSSALLAPRALLEPFGIMQFYTDNWGTDERPIAPAFHTVGKRYTQRIECKHLTLGTRIKHLAHKAICFSKPIWLHDVVIGLFINHYKFGVDVFAGALFVNNSCCQTAASSSLTLIQLMQHPMSGIEGILGNMRLNWCTVMRPELDKGELRGNVLSVPIITTNITGVNTH